MPTELVHDQYLERARVLPENCPFWSPRVTLARIESGQIDFTHTIGEKEALLADAVRDMRRGIVFFVAWTGEWHTDLFAVSVEDIARFRDARRLDLRKQEAERRERKAAKKKARRR